MEHDNPNGQESARPPESKPRWLINRLPETLGLIETSEMQRLRELVGEAVNGGADETLPQLFADFKIRGEAQVEQLTGEQYTLAQIGLIIATGLLRRDAGRAEAATADLDDALAYAENLGLSDELTEALQAEIARLQEREPAGELIADVLRSLGEDYGFDDETCREIAELPADEAFETAYGYLVQAGLDPDEILANFLNLDE